MRSTLALTRLLFVATISICVPGCGSSSVPDGPSGPPVLTNSIVFVSTRGGTPQVYVMNADGTNARAITSSAGNKSSPDVSPDGTRIVFSADVDSATQSIFVVNSDGTGLTRLTNGPEQNYSPTWSGGGDRIAYVSYPSNNAEIFVMNNDGSGERNLTNFPQNDNHPSWAARWDMILFDSYREPPGAGPGQIYASAPVGDSVRLMTIGVQPSWSPTGGRFAFVGENGTISIALADASGVTVISDSLSDHYFPRWSPDESKIVFIHTDNLAAHPEIWVEGTDGSNLHPLTTLANGDNYSPSYTRH
jgi:Tol biopolymer transport system component